MNKEEIHIITLGDIFKNIETEEKAFKFLDYIKQLQQELTDYKERNKTLLDIIRYYKTTEWGLRGYEILDNFEEILDKKEGK